MKLITLNVWGGKMFEPLMNFLRREASTTDIFCFQEIFDDAKLRMCPPDVKLDIYSDVVQALSGFQSYIAPSQIGGEALAIFVRGAYQVVFHGDVFVYGSRNSLTKNDPLHLGRNVEYIILRAGEKEYLIANFHGLWNGKGKTDSSERLMQTKGVVRLLEGYPAMAKIICGDFNLLPDTESMRMLEQHGLCNLVRKHGVASTRSRYYKDYNNGVLFADYILTSPEVQVHHFQVFPDEVSDHLPLMVEFS